MKLFGEYLIEKNLIQPDHLVQALVEQHQSLPSVLMIASKAKWLNSEQFLQVFNKQTRENVEFKKASELLGFWKPEFDEVVKNEINSVRTPIGQILVKNGSIQFETLTRALDEFLSTQSTSDEKTASSAPTAPTAPVASPQIGAETPVPATLPPSTLTSNKPLLDPVLVQEYCDYVDPGKIQILNNHISAIQNTTESTERVSELKSFLEGIHRIRGMARCIRADLSETLIDRMELATLAILKKKGEISAENIKIFHDQCLIGLDTLLQLRELIKNESAENSALTDPVLSSLISEVQQTLESLKNNV